MITKWFFKNEIYKNKHFYLFFILFGNFVCHVNNQANHQRKIFSYLVLPDENFSLLTFISFEQIFSNINSITK